jgi:hypothetical protein
MRVAAGVLLAAFVLQAAGVEFNVMDARGKKAPGVTVEAGAPDADGWFALKIVKAKGDPVLVWPFDGAAKAPDGPEPIPAIIIQRGDEKVLAKSSHAIAAMATPVVLGVAAVEDLAGKTGLGVEGLRSAFAAMKTSGDPFEKGVGLLYSNQAPEAAEQLGLALKQRQRQLTRTPSEIYSVALLYGRALYAANKFDDAAVAFLVAVKQRQSDTLARRFRSEALVKAGKPDAADR